MLFRSRPVFRIVVLYIDEGESIRRQVKRGKMVREHNLMVQQTGEGSLLVERATDYDPNLIRARYQIFTQHFGALMRLKKLFPFHLINASGSIEDVMHAIWREFEYQSSLELEQETYDTIQHIPIAPKIGIHARQELVRRLESYQFQEPSTLKAAVELIEEHFLPAIRRHAISGSCVVRLTDTQMPKGAVDMIVDVLSERGYRVSVDCMTTKTPSKMNLVTGDIVCSTESSHLFQIRFPEIQIRGIFGQTDDAVHRHMAGDVVDTEPCEPLPK